MPRKKEAPIRDPIPLGFENQDRIEETHLFTPFLATYIGMLKLSRKVSYLQNELWNLCAFPTACLSSNDDDVVI